MTKFALHQRYIDIHHTRNYAINIIQPTVLPQCRIVAFSMQSSPDILCSHIFVGRTLFTLTIRLRDAQSFPSESQLNSTPSPPQSRAGDLNSVSSAHTHLVGSAA